MAGLFVARGEHVDFLPRVPSDGDAHGAGEQRGEHVPAGEAIDDQGGLRQTFWSNMLGSDYIAQAFTLARAADPQATVLYNDYGGEALGVKARKLRGVFMPSRMARFA